MNVGTLQDLADDIAPKLAKLLSGCSPEFEVRLKIDGKLPTNLDEVNKLLEQIDPEWKL